MQWTMEREGQYGTIQCLDNYDITGDGVRELVVGRHDGTIEVYAYEDGEDVEPTLRFSHVSQSARGMRCVFSERDYRERFAECLQEIYSAIYT